MFPNFPNLAEAIAAERAADFERDAARYRRAHHPSAHGRRARRARQAESARRPQQMVSRVPAGTVSRESCAASRAI
jgi:hypothetical protein